MLTQINAWTRGLVDSWTTALSYTPDIGLTIKD